MCLIVDKEKFRVKIAQEDIVVYKALGKDDENVISPYWEFVYEIGKEYKTKMKLQFFNNYYEIHEGFHSFLNEKDAKLEESTLRYCKVQDGYLDFCCFRCIIPKGSEIIYGKYCEKDAIVSEAIKIIERV